MEPVGDRIRQEGRAICVLRPIRVLTKTRISAVSQTPIKGRRRNYLNLCTIVNGPTFVTDYLLFLSYY